jgi:Integrase core domain
MGIRDRPTSFRSPWQNGYVERLIGSIRRECTDHLIVLNEEHLRRILARFSAYYNGWRPHVSLGKDAPDGRPIDRFGDMSPMQSWADCITGTHESSFWKRQPSGIESEIVARRLVEHLDLRRRFGSPTNTKIPTGSAGSAPRVWVRDTALHRHIGLPGRVLARAIAVEGPAIRQPSRVVDVGVVNAYVSIVPWHEEMKVVARQCAIVYRS